MKFMRTYNMSISSCIAFVVFVLALSSAHASLADTRQDAITAISNLRMAGHDKMTPDEMKSLDASFAIAERHFQANDTINSEQFFLLTIQKALILSGKISNQPVNQQVQAGESSSLPDILQSESLPGATMPPDTRAAPTSLATSDDKREPATHSEHIVSEKLVGTSGFYTIIKGDTLRLIAAKLGVSRQHLNRMNNLDTKSLLRVGKKLRYNNRKIIPMRMHEGIVVNIPDRTLYFFQRGKLVRSLPVALGTVTKNEKYVWQTPTGKFKIIAKQENPTWYVPLSIQAEMEDEGKEVITSVPPGPDNPLGKYAIKTSIPGILIHSTTKPWSIYSFASHGCIRVYPVQMEELFKEVKVNTPGEIIYQPVKLAVTEEGRVFLEAHIDVYSKSIDLAAEARKLVEKNQLSDRIDWKKFESVVNQKRGIAEDITL